MGYSLNERLLLLLLLMVIGLGKLIELIQLDRFQQGLWCLYLIQIMYLCLDIKLELFKVYYYAEDTRTFGKFVGDI